MARRGCSWKTIGNKAAIPKLADSAPNSTHQSTDSRGTRPDVPSADAQAVEQCSASQGDRGGDRLRQLRRRGLDAALASSGHDTAAPLRRFQRYASAARTRAPRAARGFRLRVSGAARPRGSAGCARAAIAHGSGRPHRDRNRRRPRLDVGHQSQPAHRLARAHRPSSRPVPVAKSRRPGGSCRRGVPLGPFSCPRSDCSEARTVCSCSTSLCFISPMIQHRFLCSGFFWHVCQPLSRTLRLLRLTSSRGLFDSRSRCECQGPVPYGRSWSRAVGR